MKIVPLLVLALILSAASINAAGPQVWSVNSRASVLKGDARGVSIDQNGTITIAPQLTEVFRTEQAYIWSSVIDSSGNAYFGTGGDGKIFRVDAVGKGNLLVDLGELNVTALAAGRGGEIFAGTSPDGKVYRIDASGRAETYFAPGDKYIWALANLPDGSLAVATGDGGKIYRVRAPGAAPADALLFDTSETHVISLAVDVQGNLYAGTDSNGIVMRFGLDGKPFGLLDSPLREIHELAVGPDGSVYALALGDSASAAKPPEAPPPAASTEARTVSAERTGTVGAEPPAKSRYDLTGAKSAVYRILPDGGNDLLWASASITGFSIFAEQTGGGVLIGTSDKGRIYGITNDGRETLRVQTDANQISTLRMGASGLIATSSNAGTVYRVGPATVAEGSYESPVLDAKGSAAWGRIWWRAGGNVTLQTRSGNTDSPNETWSAWSGTLTDQTGGPVTSPRARFIQWRAVLKGGAQTFLSEVNLAFAGRNIAPEILSITVLPTGVGLVANPPIQIDPNIALSGLDPSAFGIASTVVAPRRVYQRGAVSLQWAAEDRNGDDLVFDVFYREAADTTFKLLRQDLRENFIAVDGQSLADGRYIFRIAARDTPSNSSDTALAGDRLTEPVNIDNTAPTVAVISGQPSEIIFEATDKSSYLTRAEYSINGGEWMTVYPEDGISDSSRERYSVKVPAGSGEFSITLRAFDVNGNAGNARHVLRKN